VSSHAAAARASSGAAALALALVAAVSLGPAGFSSALLLPPMRADPGWTYFTAGAMNTVNAAGYRAGALLAPPVLARFDARSLLLAGGAGTALLLAAHGLVRGEALLYLLRGLAGLASAASFVDGGLLAARLAGAQPGRSGLVLGIYDGGVGLGIVASSLIVPAVVGPHPSGWPAAWIALGAAALLANALTALGTRPLTAPPMHGAVRAPFVWRQLGFGLAGYTMFGLGCIGYMTFVVTLLREQGQGTGVVTMCYVLLGCGVAASSWIWAGLLQRWRGGGPLALLNALLALATMLPVVSAAPWVAFVSGALFGGVLLSVVASTTALVRHNVEPAAWTAGIAAFTIVFSAGQIAGPSVIGWIADGPGGLVRGFALSAAVLAVGAALASRQRPLRMPRAAPG
jgi:predicted MFS family arabinose efflux permease